MTHDYGKWHPATDQLEGTSVYGTAYDDRNNWSVKYSHMTYNQFLFTSGDRTKWLIANKESVFGIYSNSPRNILRSSKYSVGTSKRWYKRSGLREDPWISIDDHNNGYKIVYGGNSFTGRQFDYIRNNGGMKVYIR